MACVLHSGGSKCPYDCLWDHKVCQAWRHTPFKSSLFCATPGAEHRHEIFFYFFHFSQSTFCWQAGDTFWEHSQLNIRLLSGWKKRRLVWDFEKETLQTDQEQKSEKMVWDFFSRFQTHISAERKAFFFANFSRKKSRTGRLLFSATPSRWVFAQLFQAIFTTAMGHLNLQGGDINPCIVRDVASGLMQFQPTALFVGTLSTHNSEILIWKNGLLFVLFRSATLAATICFACFNPPSTCQRLNSLGSSNPAGLYMFPWLAGLLTRRLTSCALGWGENLRWKFQTTLFLRNKINHIWNFRCRFSLRVSPAFSPVFFTCVFSPAFFACVFRLSFRFSFRNQAIELDAACSTRALALIVPFFLGRVLCKIP